MSQKMLMASALMLPLVGAAETPVESQTTSAVLPRTAHNRREVKNSTWFWMISVDGL
jgi:hypothetical protein